MGLLPLIGGRITAGSVRFDGTDLVALPEDKLRALRGRRVAFITQNPMTALDPVQKIGAQVDVVSRLHLRLSAKAARARTVDLLTQLRIPEAATICDAYPHQLSGGMKQRIVIAMALAGEPDLIVADEPTTALDVTAQAQIIHILAALVREKGLALILITHDMGVVAQVCTSVAVLYAGRLAEHNGPDRLYPPHHAGAGQSDRHTRCGAQRCQLSSRLPVPSALRPRHRAVQGRGATAPPFRSRHGCLPHRRGRRCLT